MSEDLPIEMRLVAAEPWDSKYLRWQLTFSAPLTGEEAARTVQAFFDQDIRKQGLSIQVKPLCAVTERDYLIIYEGHRHTDHYYVVVDPVGGRNKFADLVSDGGPGYLTDLMVSRFL